MGYLPATPLGLVLPDPTTVQNFETVNVNGNFLALQTAIQAIALPRQRYGWQESTSDSGGTVAGGSQANGALRNFVVPTGVQNTLLRIHQNAYIYLGSAAVLAGDLRVLIDGVPVADNVRFNGQSRAGALYPSGSWDIPVAAGSHTVQCAVRADSASNTFELRNWRNAISVEW